MLPISKRTSSRITTGAATPDSTCSVCARPVRYGYLMCFEHWQLVPPELRSQVYIALGRARNARRVCTKPLWQRYREAIDTATRAVQLHLADEGQPTNG